MKMIKYSLMILLLTMFSSTHANEKNMKNYFEDKTGCFIFYNVSKEKIVERYNPKQCAKRISPHSTFKIPLSVMAFDQNLISFDTVFKWDGQPKGFSQWDGDQTPSTWLQHSVVWVSQTITPKLGLLKIKKYLAGFEYGNQDFSGNPGKNDGITQAWLSSSLKISADEQLNFLKRFSDNSLSVSHQAVQLTEKNIFLRKFANGWELYGKTGSGYNQQGMQEGWFVGFIKKGKQKYIFVTNFIDPMPGHKTEFGGAIAKNISLRILHAKYLIS